MSAQSVESPKQHAADNSVEISYPDPGAQLPLMVEPLESGSNLGAWARAQPAFVESQLMKHSALLFRGFGVNSVKDFADFAEAMCSDLYGDYGDLPQEDEGRRVYRSTPYPADKTILFHNESSHMHQWPTRQFFSCVTAAEEGGETPIVDCREIYRKLGDDVVRVFEDKKLMYVRNFIDGFDVNWRDFYQTEDKQEVEKRCLATGTEFEWTDSGLRTRQIAPAVARHPKTGEMAFFNQIQLYHVACLEPDIRTSLEAVFGPDGFPRSVLYGDGTAIEDSLVEEILKLYWDCSVAFSWQEGDVVMVDNMMCAHARNPFSGARKIIVAMGDLFDGRQLS